jgi:hypothetical protein
VFFACFAIAAIMAIGGVRGWGWFLFISLFLDIPQ